MPCAELKVPGSRFKVQSLGKTDGFLRLHTTFDAKTPEISACVLSGQRKNCQFAMQAQDATTLFLLKLWPWVEANRNRLIGGAVIAVIAIFIIWFAACQREARQIAAGQALTQVSLSGGVPSADAYLKVAAQYSGTVAGQRALLQGAAALFDAGKFADAQAQFQQFLDAHPDGDFSGQAALGLASCLDAEGKADLAVGAYQRVINSASDIMVVSAAKFGLARIEEAQGRLNDAFVLYQDVASANPGSSLGSEANMHLIELRNRLTATPAQTPAAPLKLSH
jgi:predicted negative regulator of RcsB-dependent stress response